MQNLQTFNQFSLLLVRNTVFVICEILGSHGHNKAGAMFWDVTLRSLIAVNI